MIDIHFYTIKAPPAYSKICGRRDMDRKEILIIGGDARQYYMAKYLQNRGYSITAYGEIFAEGFTGCRILSAAKDVFSLLEEKKISVVLPVPVTVDGDIIKGTNSAIRLAELISHLSGQDKIYGGNLPVNLREHCGINGIDFMKSNRVAYLNAVSTAEGAIAEAIMLGRGQLSGSACLVMGFGRCGAVLAHKLGRFGAKVTVMERKPERRAEAAAYEFASCGFGEDKTKISEYNYIFNTVPAPVIREDFLKKCGRETVIIDIASAPGGVDYEAAKQLNINAKLCLSLPGKYAPKTAGEILAEELIREESKDS